MCDPLLPSDEIEALLERQARQLLKRKTGEEFDPAGQDEEDVAEGSALLGV